MIKKQFIWRVCLSGKNHNISFTVEDQVTWVLTAMILYFDGNPLNYPPASRQARST